MQLYLHTYTHTYTHRKRWLSKYLGLPDPLLPSHPTSAILTTSLLSVPGTLLPLLALIVSLPLRHLTIMAVTTEANGLGCPLGVCHMCHLVQHKAIGDHTGSPACSSLVLCGPEGPGNALHPGTALQAFCAPAQARQGPPVARLCLSGPLVQLSSEKLPEDT